MCGDLKGFTNTEKMERDTGATSNEPVTREFEVVSVVLHAQDQAATPIGQQLAHVNVRFEPRPGCLEISAQQEATTSGRVILWRQLTYESRPEERVQQVQVWRSGRLEDDVPSREWHVFFAPHPGPDTCMTGRRWLHMMRQSVDRDKSEPDCLNSTWTSETLALGLASR